MRYFKILDKDGKMCGVGKNDNIGIEITEAEYNDFMKPIIEEQERQRVEFEEAKALRKALLEMGFTFSPKPQEMPSRVGFEWKPSLNLERRTMNWAEVENPNARGTRRNPFGWLPNTKVYAKRFYRHNNAVHSCIKDGSPREFTREHFGDAEVVD